MELTADEVMAGLGLVAVIISIIKIFVDSYTK